ncbi:MAG: biotin--[Blautia sp.]|nr:biotin--[acetyl-CoA-carboxylase] ligase [Blautia sp.]
MRTKDRLIRMLLASGDEFISGSVLAERFQISRAAVWKNIKVLEREGYQIEAITNRGYRLVPDSDVVRQETVGYYLGEQISLFDLQVYPTITSTNACLMEQARQSPHWSVVVAGAQSMGRGRRGRSFFSPADSGVYLSVLLKQNIAYTDAGLLTTAAAIAACRAIESCTQAQAQIKWVNDVFVKGRKVCGILTEASVNYETGTPDYVVVGIGLNVYTPDEGFPEELTGIAGSITEKRQRNLRSRLASAFLLAFYDICRNLKSPDLHEEYAHRCFILGKPVFVLKKEEKIPAEAIGILENYNLLVRYADGREEALTGGEISIRPV